MLYFVIDIITHTGNFYQNYHLKHGECFLEKRYAGSTNEAYAVHMKVYSANDCYQEYFDNYY